jgi:ketosteroid isomerase-like protein
VPDVNVALAANERAAHETGHNPGEASRLTSMSDDAAVGAAQSASERLARLYFDLAGKGSDPGLLELLHVDVEIVLRKLGGPRTLRGKDEVTRFIAEELPELFPVYESSAEIFRVVDDERVIVEGRMRWMDEHRVLRDDPTIWALEFRDGLLFRSTSVRSLSEAHAILAPRPDREAEL